MEKLKRVIIKEELVALTGNFVKAILLNQFIYWSERVKDFDKFIEEEKRRAEKEGEEVNIEYSNGWIYKTSEELSEETMVGLSPQTVRRYLKELIDNEWIYERNNPQYKWDRTKQYRVNIVKIQKDLRKLGYSLEGYPLNIYKDNGIEDIIIYNRDNNSGESNLQNGKSKIEKWKYKDTDLENQTLKSGEAIPEITTEITTKNTTEEYILSPAPFSEDDINQLNEKEKDKDANRIEKVPYQKIVDAYNDICVSMPSVKAVTTKRKEKMKILYREVQDLDVIEECFRKAEKSSFLNGSSGKWSGCNFDWLVNYNNFVKVLEGTYDDKEVVKKRKEIDYEAAARNSKYGF